MRELADESRIRRFMRGDAAREEGTCYLTGGATAVLLGRRSVELASPADFIPLLTIDVPDFRRSVEGFVAS